uniref:AP2/ERF domain-containing protein n=1 Tax=Grammatophora oceanica TaxID=210454 RepID=A0A7S1UUS6_9STRA
MNIDAAGLRSIEFCGVDLMTVSDQPLLLRQADHPTCKYKGVTLRGRRYEAKISDGRNKMKCLGRFDTQEEAAAIYAKAAYVKKLKR